MTQRSRNTLIKRQILAVFLLLLTLISPGSATEGENRNLADNIPGKKDPNKDVIMLVELIRHGARAPLAPISQPDWVKKTGLGELTPVGQRQHYNLGKLTRLRYPSLFSKKLKYNEYNIISTDYNRTVESAISNFIGISEPFREVEDLPFKNGDERLNPPQKINFDAAAETKFRSPLPGGFVPFPVHMRINGTDTLFKLNNKKVCPSNSKLVEYSEEKVDKYLSASPVVKSIVKKAEKIFGIKKKEKTQNDGKGEKKRVKKHDDDMDGESFYRRCVHIADFIVMDNLNNPNPKISETDPDYVNYRRCYWTWITSSFNNTLAARIMASPMLEKVVTLFEAKKRTILAGKPEIAPLKLQILSAHDTTLTSVLTAFGWLENNCLNEELYHNKTIEGCKFGPEPASSIAFELRGAIDPFSAVKETGSIDLKVGVLYNGKRLKICGEKDICELKEFTELLNNKIIFPVWREFCGIVDREQRKNDFLRFLFLIAISVSIGVVLCYVCRGKSIFGFGFNTGGGGLDAGNSSELSSYEEGVPQRYESTKLDYSVEKL